MTPKTAPRDITAARLALYDELTPAGKEFVDTIAQALEIKLKDKWSLSAIGPKSAIELAIAMIQWSEF